MSRAERRRLRKRPLSDPRRAPFVRAVLDRKQREAEQAAAKSRDAEAQARGLAHIRDCLLLVEGEDS